MPSRAPSRKQLRKEQRKQKKARKNEYFSRGKHPKPMQSDKPVQNEKPPKKNENPQKLPMKKPKKDTLNQIDQDRKREEKEINMLKKKMAEQRKKQLLLANEEEDRNIKKLEKQLKLNKRKSKGLPKMFVESGLDYILEICDPEQMKVIAEAEKKFTNIEDELADDSASVTEEKNPSKKKKVNGKKKNNSSEKLISSQKISQELSDEYSGNNNENFSEEDTSDSDEVSDEQFENEDFSDEELSDDYMMSEDSSNNDISNASAVEQSVKSTKKRKKTFKEPSKSNKLLKLEEEKTDDESNMDDDENLDEESLSEDEDEQYSDTESDEFIDEEEEFGMDEKLNFQSKKSTKAQKDSTGDSKTKRRKNDEVMQPKKIKEKKSTPDIPELDENSDDSNNESSEEYENSGDFEDEFSDDDGTNTDVPKIKGAVKTNPDGTWEDIYGRLHAKDGTLITKSNEKYIPPAVRAKLNQNAIEDKDVIEKLNRLKKQLKGLLNRLAISNMHNILKQIENLYMSNSRNDMNETLGSLINESIISQVLTPERLLIEHILLVAVLHANVGTEVGAHFLQVLVTKFDQYMKNNCEVEDKTLDNIVIALAQLYNFKVSDSKLMYEILNELAKKFTEKNVDCILHVLRNVGFVLRKDDPLALKNFILESNKKASSVVSDALNGSRLRFLLDVLTAIKNNNVTKIPNYDDTYSEHLKKVMKGFIRKGNYVTQLNISLDDLLKAEEKGKWWIVGSAWQGNLENKEKTEKKENKPKYSEQLIAMARKMRMNTDTRRDIFCVIMSADDYDDAFEKLMHLGLTKNQENEIMNVILHCCVKENPFNPYYAYLAEKFCEYDRKYMLTLRNSVWDKLKNLENESANSRSSLASLLIQLFLNKSLPISILKVIEFEQMDKITMKFLEKIFLGILLSDTESCINVFKNVAQSVELKKFRKSLRLFLHIFIRKNHKSEEIDEKQREILKNRSTMIERLLVIKDRI